MDFTEQFWHTATVAWACGVISLLCALEAWRQQLFRWQLIGGILAGLSGVMCPATLTRGYYEMVVVNQELATLVAAKRAEGVGHERAVQLVRADVAESTIGSRFERREYGDGSVGFVRSVPFVRGRLGRRAAENGRTESEDFRPDGRVLEMPGTAIDSRISWH